MCDSSVSWSEYEGGASIKAIIVIFRQIIGFEAPF